MGQTTNIEWTERTWNPTRGCSIVSAGCVNCYAMRQAHRFSGRGAAYEGLTKLTKAGPQWTGTVITVEDKLLEPLSWNQPARVFVDSMSDLFHEDVSDAFIDRVFAVMAQAPRHTFQALTKRADRMRVYLSHPDVGQRVAELAMSYACKGDFDAFEDDWTAEDAENYIRAWPLPNVWLGVSAENQEQADTRIPQLLETPAAVRFVSAEPLLGPIDLRPFLAGRKLVHGDPDACHLPRVKGGCAGHDMPVVDWVIVGGESGPGARRHNVAWMRSVVRQAKAAKVPVFVKQLGSVVIDRNDAGFLGECPSDWPDVIDIEDRVEHDLDGSRDGYQGAPVRIHLKHRKGGDPMEWPRDLRVRKFPAVRPCA